MSVICQQSNASCHLLSEWVTPVSPATHLTQPGTQSFTSSGCYILLNWSRLSAPCCLVGEWRSIDQSIKYGDTACDWLVEHRGLPSLPERFCYDMRATCRYWLKHHVVYQSLSPAALVRYQYFRRCCYKHICFCDIYRWERLGQSK